jgi:hypothetical protein
VREVLLLHTILPVARSLAEEGARFMHSNGNHILLIEASLQLKTTISTVLEDQGYMVHDFRHVDEALS